MPDQVKVKQIDNASTPLLEWLLALVGLVLVLSSVGFLLYQAVTGNETPPDIALELETIIPTGQGYLVQFRAINQGETTAKGLIIEGQLTDAGQAVEKSETTLDYLPARSKREGGLFFTENPDQFQLQLRALGYQQP